MKVQCCDCNGSGHRECPDCDGEGGGFVDRWNPHLEQHFTEDVVCDSCDGQSVTECGLCDGEGEFDG